MQCLRLDIRKMFLIVLLGGLLIAPGTCGAPASKTALPELPNEIQLKIAEYAVGRVHRVPLAPEHARTWCALRSVNRRWHNTCASFTLDQRCKALMKAHTAATPLSTRATETSLPAPRFAPFSVITFSRNLHIRYPNGMPQECQDPSLLNRESDVLVYGKEAFGTSRDDPLPRPLKHARSAVKTVEADSWNRDDLKRINPQWLGQVVYACYRYTWFQNGQSIWHSPPIARSTDFQPEYTPLVLGSLEVDSIGMHAEDTPDGSRITIRTSGLWSPHVQGIQTLYNRAALSTLFPGVQNAVSCVQRLCYQDVTNTSILLTQNCWGLKELQFSNCQLQHVRLTNCPQLRTIILQNSKIRQRLSICDPQNDITIKITGYSGHEDQELVHTQTDPAHWHDPQNPNRREEVFYREHKLAPEVWERAPYIREATQ
jgi:hypothetical protein